MNEVNPIRPALVIILLFVLTVSIAKWRAGLYGEDTRRFLMRVFAWSLALRALLSVVLYFGAPLINPGHDLLGVGFFNDDGLYYWEEHGRLLSECWTGVSTCGELPSTKFGYIYVVGAVYAAAGHFPLIIRLMHAMFGSVLPIIIFEIAYNVGLVSIARRACKFTAFLPSLVLYAVVDVRDIVTSTAVSAGILAAVLARKQLHLSRLIMLVATCFALYTLRPQWALLLGVGGTYIVVQSLGHRLKVPVLPVVLIASLAGVLLLSSFGRQFVEESADGKADYDALYLNSDQSHGAAYDSVVGLRETGSATSLAFVGISLVLTLLTPFPFWALRTDSAMLGMDSALNLGWYVLLPYFVFGLDRILRQKHTRALGIVLMVYVLLCALQFSGSAAAGRYRVDILPLMMIAVAVGYEHLRRNGLQIRATLFQWVIAVASLGYYALGK